METRMSYTPLYSPSRLPQHAEGNGGTQSGLDAEIYIYESRTTLAVNVALATGRPLLVRGPVGCGKSMLARNVACHLGWKIYEATFTSRTQTQDLLWTLDAVKRLADAQLLATQQKPLPPLSQYIRPGVLWWAYSPESAQKRGCKDELEGQPADPGTRLPRPGFSDASSSAPARPVVLLDEIDKADPDEPDNLLDVLDRGSFTVDPIDFRVDMSSVAPLVFLTSNNARQLSAAFRRRCVVLDLEHKTTDELVAIATSRYGSRPDSLYERIATKTTEARQRTREDRPGTAEFLDAVEACIRLDAATTQAEWESIEQLLLLKTRPA